jgi:predicted transcriptional regulator
VVDDLEYVRRQLSAPDINLSAVAEGAGVKPRWLRTFAAGDIPEPGYSKVKRLAEYFRARRGRLKAYG